MFRVVPFLLIFATAAEAISLASVCRLSLSWAGLVRPPRRVRPAPARPPRVRGERPPIPRARGYTTEIVSDPDFEGCFLYRAKLTGSDRTVFEDAHIEAFFEKDPAFLRKLGITPLEGGGFQYPDTFGLNDRILAMRRAKDPQAPAFLFWEDASAEGASVGQILENLAERRVPLSLDGFLPVGSLHYHDRWVHGLGFALFPEETVAEIATMARFLLALRGSRAYGIGSFRAVVDEHALSYVVEQIDGRSTYVLVDYLKGYKKDLVYQLSMLGTIPHLEATLAALDRLSIPPWSLLELRALRRRFPPNEAYDYKALGNRLIPE